LRSDVPLLEREHELAVVAGLVDAAASASGASTRQKILPAASSTQ
jgi:hypothetical protein